MIVMGIAFKPTNEKSEDSETEPTKITGKLQCSD
jgi:hypothetical protein